MQTKWNILKLIYLQWIQLFTFYITDKLRSFIYDLHQEDEGHENSGNSCKLLRMIFGEVESFFPSYVKFSNIFWDGY